MADAGENARIGNLVTIEVEDRQNYAVGYGIEKFVRMPARCQRSGLRFTVADDAGNDKIRVVEGGSVGMRECVTKFAAFVDRAGRLRRHMARDPARERELGEQAFHALFVDRDVRIDLAVGALEV